jgi:hypothetical protein
MSHDRYSAGALATLSGYRADFIIDAGPPGVVEFGTSGRE